MRYLRNKRRFAGLGALAAVAGVTLWFVLPALASPSFVPIPPKSTINQITPGDIPLGGVSGDCTNSTFGVSNGTYEYDIKNPKSGTYSRGVPGGASFTLVNTNDQTLEITATGAGIVDLGINGGTHTARYNYDGSWADSTNWGNPVPGFTMHDAGLHAPAQSSNQLYSLSHVDICYSLVGTVSGTVYQDKTAPANGSQDQGDPGLSGWTVNLYQSATSSGPIPSSAPILTTTTDAAGGYTFALPFTVNAYYTICESATDANGASIPPPAGFDAWAQSQPTPSAKDYFHCSTSRGELPNGYQFKATSAAENVNTAESNDFKLGNVGGYSCPTSGIPYQVSGKCKPDQTYVQTSGVLPDGTPYASLWAGDQTLTTKVPVIEQIPWDYSSVAQNQLTVMYTDVPMSTTGLHAMRYCKRDPSQDVGTWDFGQPLPSGVLPDSDPADPEDSSCLISTSIEWSTDPNTGQPVKLFIAKVYSAADGYRAGVG
jgi:hypothetical protein